MRDGGISRAVDAAKAEDKAAAAAAAAAARKLAIKNRRKKKSSSDTPFKTRKKPKRPPATEAEIPFCVVFAEGEDETPRVMLDAMASKLVSLFDLSAQGQLVLEATLATGYHVQYSLKSTYMYTMCQLC